MNVAEALEEQRYFELAAWYARDGHHGAAAEMIAAGNRAEVDDAHDALKELGLDLDA